jgi:1A family penicillin-binding protein
MKVLSRFMGPCSSFLHDSENEVPFPHFPPDLRRSSSIHPARLHPALLFLALTLGAQEPIASYPPLPAGASPILVMDSKGRYVGRLLAQKRYWVPLEQIPPFLRQALLAVEDARFYEHGAIDLRGIARALLKDVRKGRLAEGGSTITQQLMKNKFLSGEVSLDRKVKEARLAMEFEKKYSKSQILEMYFNEIYFGNGAMGIAQAAQLYFNKRPEALSEAECLALAGVPKNPGRYNPLGKPVDIAQRQEVVLKRLQDLELITPAQAQALRARPAKATGPSRAPAYLAAVRSKLVERFGVDAIEQGGMDVFVTMDLDLQTEAERALKDGVARLGGNLQGALVCLDPATGDVLAAVGGVGTEANASNRAFFAKRQPGSAIKPLIYAAAVEQGIACSSRWNDAPVAYRWGQGESWKPQNYGREEFGDLTLAQALAHSSNVVTVKLLETIGVPALVDYAGRLGLPQRAQNGLSLALGTDEVTLKDLVQAYTPFAAAGQLAEARTLLRIHDLRKGTWIENPPALTPVLSPGAAWLTTHMLADVLTYGTAKSLSRFSAAHPAAGKTGTTDAAQDAWFVGFTPQLLTGVWVGSDQPRPLGRGFTGGTAAAPIWERFMTRALAGRTDTDFPRPETVIIRRIDPVTGQLARRDCPEPQEALFLDGKEPTEPCGAHGGEPLAQPAPPSPEAVNPPV